jgi:hypothetical protein
MRADSKHCDKFLFIDGTFGDKNGRSHSVITAARLEPLPATKNTPHPRCLRAARKAADDRDGAVRVHPITERVHTDRDEWAFDNWR